MGKPQNKPAPRKNAEAFDLPEGDETVPQSKVDEVLSDVRRVDRDAPEKSVSAEAPSKKSTGNKVYENHAKFKKFKKENSK